MQKISISDLPTPKTKDPRLVCNWLLNSLGLINRDEQGDKMTDIFMFLAGKSQAKDQNAPSKAAKIEEIQAHTGLPRSTCYKYIGRLIDSGLVKKIAANEYALSEGEIARIIQNIRKDTDKVLEKLQDRTAQLDKEMQFV
ncbi:MAG: helix-turn-helix domain-containing protein [Candidatus Aenigmarchaeota archaeon]|nr:helix-turn-helix domain-containing protein [Candidatus Aenigmarchaeota archaeon]